MKQLNYIDMTESYFLQSSKTIFVIYFLLLFIVIITLSSLPFIRTTISTRAMGITRPLNERTDLRPVASDVVHHIIYKEGDTVQKEAIIALLRDDNSPVEEKKPH